MNEIEMKREKITKYVKYWLIGLVCLAMSPIIMAVISGMLGLIVAFVVGSTAIALTPWFSMKLANWKVKSVVSESRENPIETMTNLISAKKRPLKNLKHR